MTKELDTDRAIVQQQVRALHALGHKAGLYTTTRQVTFVWWENLPFGPRFIRERIQLRQESTEAASVFSLNPKRDTPKIQSAKHEESKVPSVKPDEPEVLMVDDGSAGGLIAIWQPGSKKRKARFETFSFQRGSSQDFDYVRNVIRKWRDAQPRVLSIAEEVELRKNPEYIHNNHSH